MPRKFKPVKPLIYIFCEGESEQVYAQFLKEQFADVASIKYPSKPGLFEFAADKFAKDARYREQAEVTDEIWFFFDVELKDRSKWDERWKIIQKLRKIRRKPFVRIRLLMTTACIEYWLMLHYQLMAPELETVADKERMRHQLMQLVPEYKKGDRSSTVKIAKRYADAVRNGQQVLSALQNEGLPMIEDTDERNRWLCQAGKTFTTVHEAIVFLENLGKERIS